MDMFLKKRKKENSINCYKIKLINTQTFICYLRIANGSRNTEGTHQYPQSKGAHLMKTKNNWQLVLIKQQKEKENRKQQAKLAMAMR
jgi:hypothetical protein